MGVYLNGIDGTTSIFIIEGEQIGSNLLSTINISQPSINEMSLSSFLYF